MALLPTIMVEKPWGVSVPPPPFVHSGQQPLGEVWFQPPAALPDILIKYIFTSQRLSVQVHPSDAQLPGSGKEECWLILDAQPGAELALGFREKVSESQLRAALAENAVEHLLAWYPVAAGDFFHVPPGTVHAIGAGVTLVEVQQNSDVTYRLYDYGRPRPLHVEQAVSVAKLEPYDQALRRHIAADCSNVLLETSHFALAQISGQAWPAGMAHWGQMPCLVAPLSGTVSVGGTAVLPGACAIATDGQAIKADPDGRWLACICP